MPVIAVTNQKGGVGKTSLSVHLAAGLVRRGKSVVLIEADKQRSSSAWADLAKDASADGQGVPLGFDVVRLLDGETDAEESRLASQFPLRVADYADKFDYVVIDGMPSKERAALLMIVGTADLVVMPLQPNPVDYWSSKDELAAIEENIETINPNLKVAVVVNLQKEARKTLWAVMKGTISRFGGRARLMKSVIRDRSVLAMCPALGATVWTAGGRHASAAITEIDSFVDEVIELSGGKHG